MKKQEEAALKRMHLTTDQKVVGLNPAGVTYGVCKFLDYKSLQMFFIGIIEQK